MKTVVSAEQLKECFQHSLRALFTHIRISTKNTLPNASVGVGFRSAAQTHEQGVIQIQIYDAHTDDEANDLLWDVIESSGWTNATYQELIEWASKEAFKAHTELIGPIYVSILEDSAWWSAAPVPAQRTIWRYHPQRQIEATPWGATIPSVARRSTLALSMDDLDSLSKGFSMGLNRFYSKRPMKVRAEEKPDHGRAFNHYIEMMTQITGYVRAGKQIYDFPKTLVELFRNTDVDDIALEHVKLPYPTIYMHFGRQAEMPMGDGWYAEGVYLSELRDNNGGRYCNISLACCNDSFERFQDFDRGLEPAYSVALGPTHQTMALAEAIDLFVSDKIVRLKNDVANHAKFQTEIEEQIAVGKMPVYAESVTARNSQQELDLLMPRHESFMKLLRLAINALVYMNAYPDDIETKWPENTPPSKLRELTKAKDKKARSRALSELAKAGFTPVHLCGRKLDEQIRANATVADRAARSISMHWVRGHWRRQAHGPGNALRKIIWRMPLLRGTRQAVDDEPLGHVYLPTYIENNQH